jgi:Uma2 family endonuclease
MVQAPVKSMTLAEFLQSPETEPASEYINGQVIQKPMPQAKHSAIQGDFVTVVNQTLRSPKIARAFPEIRCTFGGRSVVPDVAVFRWENIPRDASGKLINQVTVAPDWTIEILSPEQSQSRVVRNILHCLANGTQMGWLIDPDEEMIFVYANDRTVAAFENPPQALPVPVFADAVELTVGQIFGWLVD